MSAYDSADYVVGPITPSGTVFANGTCRFLQVGVAGTATIVLANGNTITGFPLVAGQNNVRVQKITAATATGIFACY